jgi:hypothetical protein
MCRLRPEARSQAKLGQKKLGQARPLYLAWLGFWPGLRFLKAKAAGLGPGFCRYIHFIFIFIFISETKIFIIIYVHFVSQHFVATSPPKTTNANITTSPLSVELVLWRPSSTHNSILNQYSVYLPIFPSVFFF